MIFTELRWNVIRCKVKPVKYGIEENHRNIYWNLLKFTENLLVGAMSRTRRISASSSASMLWIKCRALCSSAVNIHIFIIRPWWTESSSSYVPPYGGLSYGKMLSIQLFCPYVCPSRSEGRRNFNFGKKFTFAYNWHPIFGQECLSSRSHEATQLSSVESATNLQRKLYSNIFPTQLYRAKPCIVSKMCKGAWLLLCLGLPMRY